MPTWTFTKKAGAPSGTIKIFVFNGEYDINDTTTTSIVTMDQETAHELSESPFLQMSGTIPTPIRAATAQAVFGYAGAYNPVLLYSPGQLVTEAGNTYCCILAAYNQDPATSPTYWKVFASAPGSTTVIASGSYAVTTGSTTFRAAEARSSIRAYNRDNSAVVWINYGTGAAALNQGVPLLPQGDPFLDYGYQGALTVIATAAVSIPFLVLG